MKKSTLLQIIAAILGPIMLVGAVFFATNTNYLTPIAASAYTTTFDKNNSPTLSGGSGTITDRAGIVWEYYNASNYSDGHVTLNHQGYFGVSAASPYGVTGVDCITPNFTSNGNELWLLKSVDGINWNEDHILESGNLVISANNWRYLRFYNWSDTNTSIDIKSINISYTCDQSLRNESAAENIDNARTTNVINSSDNLTAIEVTGRDSRAISFTKSGNSSSWAVISLDRTYTVDEIKYKKVEFDYYKVSTVPNTQPSYPSIQLYKNATTTVGSTQSYEPAKSQYKITVLGDNWYHIEMPISALAPTISGYKVGTKWEDNVVKTNLEVGAVKLSVGTCIVDNLRIGSTPTALGIFNNGASFNVTDEKPYWFKIAWTGEFHSCTFNFDTQIAEQVAWDNTICKSPFYVRGLSTGNVTVTATLVVGYNRQVLTVSNTLTIN